MSRRAMVVLAVAVGACGGKVDGEAAQPSCGPSAVEGSTWVTLGDCSATEPDSCDGDADAQARLRNYVRSCFGPSTSDVFAIVPAVRMNAKGCVTAFALASSTKSDACVASALAAHPRWSCLATASCTETVVRLP